MMLVVLNDRDLPQSSLRRNKFGLSVFQILLAATIWGAAYPLTKGILSLVPPLVLGFLRFSIAALVLLVITRTKPLERVEKKDRLRLGALAFWGVFVLVVGMNFGLKLAPAGVASIISGTPPLFTFLFAWIWINEIPGTRHFLALLIAMIGIAMLTKDISVGTVTLQTVGGIFLVTLPQVAWAIYTVLGKDLLKKYHWLILCRDTFVLGALMLLIPALVEGYHSGWGVWNARSFAGLLYLGILNSVGTYGLWNRALREIGATTASFLLYWQPVSGAAISFIWFDESLGRLGWGGTALVFSGLSVVLVGDYRRMVNRVL